MSLYLARGKMSRESLRSLMAKPEDRTAALRSALEAAGGKLLQLWYSASTGEVIHVYEAPTPVASCSFSFMVLASGVIDDGTDEQLLTPAQFVEAMKGAANIVSKYRAPGK